MSSTAGSRGARGLGRRWAPALLLVVVVPVLVGPVAGATPVTLDTGPRRVLIVSLPRLTWSSVQEHRPPQLMRFLRSAAVASMSTRTIGPRTASGDAYLTVGAGNRAGSTTAAMPGDAADVSEQTPDGTARDVYRRRTGIHPSGRIVVLSIAQQIARNAGLLYGAEPGALASALASTERGMGVVGNADAGLDPSVPQREVALAAMRRNGQIVAGDVSDALLEPDPLAPFGVKLDPDRLVAAARSGWDTAAVQIVEMSDLERAEQARAESTVAEGDRQFAAALQRSDTEFGRLLGTVDPTRDLVMVMSPTAPLDREQLTVFAMRGPGVQQGWARSPTTRRSGFVTLTDIAPTVLDSWGITPPSSMNDTPIVSVGTGAATSTLISTMISDNSRALFRDDITSPITVVFIVVLVLLLLCVMWAVGRGRGRWTAPLQWWALAVIAAPTAMYLSGLLTYGPFTTVSFALVVAVASLSIAGLAWVSRRWDPLAPPVLVAALGVVVLGVDIVTGGNLQLNTPFGYSPIVAGRFAGYGNQAFSILTICALIVVTGGWEIWRRKRPGSSDVARGVVAAAVFLAVIVLDGAPAWGSDVGGVISTIPAFSVCLLLLFGTRVRWRLIALITACTFGALVAFAAIDLARPVEARTHLGRFAQKLLDGGGGIILQRKLEANMSILTSTVWTFVIPVALLFIGYLTWRPNRLLRRLHDEHFGFKAFGVSGLTLGIVAWIANDSGVSIPALMLTVALPYTAYLVLGLGPSTDDPTPDGDP